MHQDRVRYAPLIVLGTVLLVPLLLALGASSRTVQDKASPQWTAESHDRTNFPLVGKHRTVGCRECHLNLVFEGTPTDCEVCHWQRRQDDRYNLRLGTRCSDCHTPQSWKKVDPPLWNHERDAGYQLEGVHRTLDCETCHGYSGFASLPTTCYACHESDYQGTDDPNHSQAGFPTACENCHDQRSWENASFDHDGFVLQGRHRSASCSDCHEGGVYQGTSSDCSSCHLDDYNGTTDPNHRASGFPLDCSQCHGSSAAGWSGASFDHPFPIQSGRHSGLACSDCHKTSDYRIFTCLECHAHDQASMNNKHSGISGYAYNSQACYACHPQGSGFIPSTRSARL